MLALAVRDLHPLDFIKRFHRLIFSSPSSKFYLARSSRFPRSPSPCSTASSSSAMIADVFCTATSRHPTSLWIIQQLREAFPFDSAPRFIIFDRDANYGLEVLAAVHSVKMSPVRTSFGSPWQNGIAERWVGSCRRDLLDHVIALNERHLKRLLSE